MKTILITGCSSGFGLETARYFLDRDWTVIATMRMPREDILPGSDRLRVLPLDVVDTDSIARAVAAAGPIDVLVNNAGVGLMNALEGVSMDTVRDVFETNTLGTIAMTRAVLPQFREQRSGVVVNVTSSVTVLPLPLLSVYTASKAAVNAFTESLALELEQFGVRVRLVIPGRAPQTAFRANSLARMGMNIPEAYGELATHIFARMQQSTEEVTQAVDVSEAVWRAATDPTCPMRLPAGADAVAWTEAAKRA
ncbi:SDR family oxidoreductase [Lichenihabitans sp. PAMC28606]|uniref:SDR family oxidoreductase n=1 Tax=Lichenihabitans sp. PAMC28606 TaxID=2880932 RepID=UPI001D0BD99C|nr:SDR family oxidoreductase [Lichenihabitans sp. PAMC28606]UDL96263.1 SDR family oxidoreductase [Lichenihabitans sp. PAMC28606]